MNQATLVFRKELYGSITFLSAWLYFGLAMTPISNNSIILIKLDSGFTLPILAIYKGLELPKFSFDDSSMPEDKPGK